MAGSRRGRGATRSRRRFAIALGLVVTTAAAIPLRVGAGEQLEAEVVAVLADPALFELTPATAATRLAPFGRLEAERTGDNVSAEGIRSRTFFIALPAHGRRAMVFFDEATNRLTHLTLLFEDDDRVDGARVRSSLDKLLGSPREHSEAGSNRIVWWDAADGRRVRITLDVPGIDPPLIYSASVGRAVSR